MSNDRMRFPWLFIVVPLLIIVSIYASSVIIAGALAKNKSEAPQIIIISTYAQLGLATLCVGSYACYTYCRRSSYEQLV